MGSKRLGTSEDEGSPTTSVVTTSWLGRETTQLLQPHNGLRALLARRY